MNRILRCASPPWTIEKADACFIVKARGGQALAYVYFEEEPGRRAAAHLLTRDEVWRIAANIAKLPELLRPMQARALANSMRTKQLQAGASTTAPEFRPSLAPSRRKQHTFGCCRHRSERHTGCR